MYIKKLHRNGFTLEAESPNDIGKMDAIQKSRVAYIRVDSCTLRLVFYTTIPCGKCKKPVCVSLSFKEKTVKCPKKYIALCDECL